MRNAVRFKPAVSARARLVLAALVWTGVGCGLLVAGLRWTLVAADGRAAALGLAAAFAVGAAKGRFLLVRRARANARRIREAGDDRCIGGAFTWPMWGLAAAMAGLGVLLRHSGLPRYWLGLVYSGVGVALAGASLAVWRELLGPRRPDPGLRPPPTRAP